MKNIELKELYYKVHEKSFPEFETWVNEELMGRDFLIKPRSIKVKVMLTNKQGTL